jgi:hypothetical protein
MDDVQPHPITLAALPTHAPRPDIVDEDKTVAAHLFFTFVEKERW